MLFQHSIIYVIAKTIPAIIAFAALSLYTNFLDPDEYGLYILINSAAVFTHTVLFNWLPSSTLRYWPDKQYSPEMFISTLVIVYLRIIVVLLLFLVVLIVFFWGTPKVTIFTSAFFMLFSLALYTITQSLLATQLYPLVYAKLVILGSILMLFFGGMLAYFSYSAPTIIFGSAVGLLLPSLLVYKNTLAFFRKGLYEKSLFKKFLTYGMPLAAAAILEEFTQFADRFMLAGMQDKAQAAIYTVGYGLAGYSVFMIMNALNLAAYPTIIKKLEDDGKEAAIDHFRKYVILLIGISLPAVAGLNLLGPNLVSLVLGKEYQEPVIMLLPWITIALLFGGIQAFYLDLGFQLGHFTKGIVKISFVTASINLILNYYLIPISGMKGAAIATLSSYVVGMILSGILARKKFPVPFPLIDFAKIILAVVSMIFVMWWLKDLRGWLSLITQLLTGFSAYVIMILLFNILESRKQFLSYLQLKN